MSPRTLNIVAIAGVVALLAIGVPLLVAQMRSLPAGGALASRSDERIVTLEVAGMTCEACVGAVKTRLVQTDGVSTAEVRLQQARAYVVVDRQVPDSLLTEAVTQAGPGFIARVVQK